MGLTTEYLISKHHYDMLSYEDKQKYYQDDTMMSDWYKMKPHKLDDCKVYYGGNDMNTNNVKTITVTGHDGWLKELYKIDTDFEQYLLPKRKGLGIKRILINAPATIVFWADGSKTVAKCGPNDTFDAEKGVFICMLKKQFGMNNVEFSKYMDYVERKVK